MNGCRVLDYSKVHTCDFGDEKMLSAGDNFYACTLVTALGEIKVGAMICYDREFPESARILMLKGAEIIITPNACELEDYRLAQYKVRSFENCVGMAMANYAAPNENGHSVAFDGVAFGENGRLRDMTAVLADEKEGIFMAEFDMDKLREARKYSIWGDAYRRPSKYAKLLDMDTLPVFDREELNRR
jgi:predicted amidohydrolase